MQISGFLVSNVGWLAEISVQTQLIAPRAFLLGAQPLGVILTLAGTAVLLAYAQHQTSNRTANFTRACLEVLKSSPHFRYASGKKSGAKLAKYMQECEDLIENEGITWFDPGFHEMEGSSKPWIFLRDERCKLVDRMGEQKRWEELGNLVGRDAEFAETTWITRHELQPRTD